ncbi:MAG: metal ABC transporter substrate-binding protein [Leifsonia sp.]
MPRFPALPAAATLAVATVMLLTGCGTAAGGADDGTGTLRVVATTTQVADFTREIAGGSAEVTQLIQPNQSAHSYDPSAADLLALSEADVLVSNGAGLEEWLDDAVEASGFDGLLIDASTGIRLDAEHAGEGEHAEDAAPDDHDHAENPHIWTDPKLAEQMVDTIAHGLAGADADQAAAILANADAYAAKLDALDAWSRENIETIPADERLFVSNHDAFGYFVEAYGIDYVGSVIPSFDDNAEPSAAEIDRLVAAITATGTQAVFSEASLSPKLADTIAREAHVKVYDGDEALYGDSLGPAGSDGDTYIAAQLHNVRQLLDSWGVTPTPLPAALGG